MAYPVHHTPSGIKEVGIRKVLGASAGRISLLFVWENFLLADRDRFLYRSAAGLVCMQQWLETLPTGYISAPGCLPSPVWSIPDRSADHRIRTIRTANVQPGKKPALE